LFNKGFGSDPCIAARLNGIQEFAAILSGIPEEALSEQKLQNAGLLKTINDLYNQDYKAPEDDDTADSFHSWLETNHAGLLDDPEFATVWPHVKMVNMLD
jgi:hypothetical protein